MKNVSQFSPDPVHECYLHGDCQSSPLHKLRNLWGVQAWCWDFTSADRYCHVTRSRFIYILAAGFRPKLVVFSPQCFRHFIVSSLQPSVQVNEWDIVNGVFPPSSTNLNSMSRWKIRIWWMESFSRAVNSPNPVSRLNRVIWCPTTLQYTAVDFPALDISSILLRACDYPPVKCL